MHSLGMTLMHRLSATEPTGLVESTGIHIEAALDAPVAACSEKSHLLADTSVSHDVSRLR